MDESKYANLAGSGRNALKEGIMKTTKSILLRVSFYGLLIALITGCRWRIDSTTSPTSTSASSFATTTPATPIVSATQADTTISILTPLPTLSTLERDKRILDLFSNNSSCKLPCWWGIMPGETTWQEAWKQLSPFKPDPYISDTSLSPQFVDFLIPVSEEISPAYSVNIRLDIKNEIVQVVNMFMYRIDEPFIRIDQFLNDYGKPTEVWIHTYRSNFGADIPADVLLFYPDQGILARYFTDATKIDAAQDTATICLDSDPVLTLWSPDNQINFNEAQDLARLDYKKYDKPLLPLNEASSISVEDFYSYRTSENICITTELGLWPEP